MTLTFEVLQEKDIPSTKEIIGMELLSLNDVGAPKMHIEENGSNPLDNAKLKALAYYDVLRVPVFSCDSGLKI